MKVQEFTVEAIHYKLQCSKCKKAFKSSSKFRVLTSMTMHLENHGILIPFDNRGALITHARSNSEVLMEAHLEGVN